MEVHFQFWSMHLNYISFLYNVLSHFKLLLFFGPLWLYWQVSLKIWQESGEEKGGVTRSKGTRAGSRTRVRCRASAHGARALPTELHGTPKLLLLKQSQRCLTCACSFPLSLSSAVSPLSPHGGALARPPVIPGVVDRRRREDLPKQACREERQKK